MSINQILPFISTVVMLWFTIDVLQRYAVRRNPAFLYWGIGLAMFGAGSFAEAYLALAWNKWIFFIWYLFGAALNAAWLGHGTLNLLVRKKWVNVVTGLLVLGSLYAGYLMLQAMPKLDESAFTTSRPVSEQYGSKALDAGETAPAGAQTFTTTYRGREVTAVRGLLPLGTPVRLTTPFYQYLWAAHAGRRRDLFCVSVLAQACDAQSRCCQCADRGGRACHLLCQHTNPPRLR